MRKFRFFVLRRELNLKFALMLTYSNSGASRLLRIAKKLDIIINGGAMPADHGLEFIEQAACQGSKTAFLVLIDAFDARTLRRSRSLHSVSAVLVNPACNEQRMDAKKEAVDPGVELSSNARFTFL